MKAFVFTFDFGIPFNPDLSDAAREIQEMRRFRCLLIPALLRQHGAEITAAWESPIGSNSEGGAVYRACWLVSTSPDAMANLKNELRKEWGVETAPNFNLFEVSMLPTEPDERFVPLPTDSD